MLNNKQKINAFINQCEYKYKFSFTFKDRKKFETNNKSISLNVLFVPHKKKEIRQTYISKQKFDIANQVILLMITNDEKWYYVALKLLSNLLRGIISNEDDDYYRLICLYSLRKKPNLGRMKMYSNIIIIVT